MSKARYIYEGAVYTFDTLSTPFWRAYTWANSTAQALSNFKHQYRKIVGLTVWAPLSLTGNITISNSH